MNAVSMMIVIPVLPRLIQSFTGSTAGAAHYVGLFATVFALVQFVVSPFIGSLSDRYGRRAIILASAFGQSVNFAVMALASNLGLLFFCAHCRWDLRGKPSSHQCLHRGHRSRSTQGDQLRVGFRSQFRRFPAGSSAWWTPRRNQPSPTLLGCCKSMPPECSLRRRRAARIAGRSQAQTREPRSGQSPRSCTLSSAAQDSHQVGHMYVAAAFLAAGALLSARYIRQQRAGMVVS
jgi:hypothetical protein